MFTIPRAPPQPLAFDSGGPRRRVLSVSPSGAAAYGNVTVLVLGEGFEDLGDPMCRFGAVEVAARVRHAGAMTCVAPPVLALSHFHIPAGRQAARRRAEAYSGAMARWPLPTECMAEQHVA